MRHLYHKTLPSRCLIEIYSLKHDFIFSGSLVFPDDVKLTTFDIDASGLYLITPEQSTTEDTINIYHLCTGV